jgi:hypothetical protein
MEERMENMFVCVYCKLSCNAPSSADRNKQNIISDAPCIGWKMMGWHMCKRERER